MAGVALGGGAQLLAEDELSLLPARQGEGEHLRLPGAQGLQGVGGLLQLLLRAGPLAAPIAG